VVSICVYADPNKYRPVAIVVPDEAMLSKFSEERKLAPPTETSLESLVENQDVVAAVLEAMLIVGKGAGLLGAELIQGLALVSEEWTPENVRPWQG